MRKHCENDSVVVFLVMMCGRVSCISLIIRTFGAKSELRVLISELMTLKDGPARAIIRM